MIKRVVSACVFVPITVYLVLKASFFWISLVVLFVAALAYAEWLNLDDRGFDIVKSVYLLCFLLIAFVFSFSRKFFEITAFFILAVHMIVNFDSLKNGEFLRNQYYFVGIFYTLLYFFAVKLMLFNNGRLLLLVVLVTIWCSDTIAMFCGRSFGKVKLAPLVSPNKTVEGALCGLFLGTAIGFGFGRLVGLPTLDTFLVSLTSNIFGILGDLAESVPKRFFKKKDSSNLIPGHGGILDRLDSFAFAVFFSYLVLLCKGYLF